MLLADKTAVIYGGGGAIGGAIARAFAREGARIFLVGRSQAKLDVVANDITAAGGFAKTAQVDALDEAAVGAHADAAAALSGGIDIAVNAVGVHHVQGASLAELSLEDFFHPVAVYVQTSFIIAKAVTRHIRRRSGVILTITTPAAHMPGPGFMGHSAAYGAVEAMTRHMAGEFGADGIRAICLRSHAIPEAIPISHSREVFDQVAARAGISVDEMLAGVAQSTLLKRLPTLDQVAETATFLASDRAGAMTGVIANLTCGAVLD